MARSVSLSRVQGMLILIAGRVRREICLREDVEYRGETQRDASSRDMT